MEEKLKQVAELRAKMGEVKEASEYHKVARLEEALNMLLDMVLPPLPPEEPVAEPQA